MNSFPSSFNSENTKFIPDPRDELKPNLCKIRADIANVVETQRQLHEEGIYFYISYDNEICVAESIGDLNDIKQQDYKTHSKDRYDSKNYPTQIEKKHNYILMTIGDELNQLFLNNFLTVHDIGL